MDDEALSLFCVFLLKIFSKNVVFWLTDLRVCAIVIMYNCSNCALAWGHGFSTHYIQGGNSMKTYVKKLLSILTALTLLVSLVLPAGVIPTFASTEDDPVVTEIDFTSGEAYYVGGYGHCVYRQ